MNFEQAEIARDFVSEYQYDMSQKWDDEVTETALSKADIECMQAFKRRLDRKKQLTILNNQKPIVSHFDDDWPNLPGAA